MFMFTAQITCQIKSSVGFGSNQEIKTSLFHPLYELIYFSTFPKYEVGIDKWYLKSCP